MIKLLKLILGAVLLFLVFLLGVRYSEPTKNLSNWLFEAKEQEIEFEEIQENNAQQDSTVNTDAVQINTGGNTVTLEKKPAPAAQDPNNVPPTTGVKVIETKVIEVKTIETKPAEVSPQPINPTTH